MRRCHSRVPCLECSVLVRGPPCDNTAVFSLLEASIYLPLFVKAEEERRAALKLFFYNWPIFLSKGCTSSRGKREEPLKPTSLFLLLGMTLIAPCRLTQSAVTLNFSLPADQSMARSRARPPQESMSVAFYQLIKVYTDKSARTLKPTPAREATNRRHGATAQQATDIWCLARRLEPRRHDATREVVPVTGEKGRHLYWSRRTNSSSRLMAKPSFRNPQKSLKSALPHPSSSSCPRP